MASSATYPRFQLQPNCTVDEVTAAVRAACRHVVTTVIQDQLAWLEDCQFSPDRISVSRITGVNQKTAATMTDFLIHWPLVVGGKVLNRHGTLHGGVAAYLIDQLTTLHAILMNPHHVSTDLHLTYLKALKRGESCTVVTRIVRCGKTLVFLDAEIVDAQGAVCIKGSHTKAVVRPKL